MGAKNDDSLVDAFRYESLRGSISSNKNGQMFCMHVLVNYFFEGLTYMALKVLRYRCLKCFTFRVTFFELFQQRHFSIVRSRLWNVS